MKVRETTPDDASQAAKWLLNTPHNGLDPSIGSYPHLYTFAVEDANGPILYVPVHPVFVVESVGCRPGITAKEYITALLEADQATQNMAQQNGIREIYTSSTYRPMHKALLRHGYKAVNGALHKKI